MGKTQCLRFDFDWHDLPVVFHWLHQARKDNARTGQEQMQPPKIPNTGGKPYSTIKHKTCLGAIVEKSWSTWKLWIYMFIMFLHEIQLIWTKFDIHTRKDKESHHQSELSLFKLKCTSSRPTLNLMSKSTTISLSLVGKNLNSPRIHL